MTKKTALKVERDRVENVERVINNEETSKFK